MSAEAKSNLPLQIAHVLFIDIVGYSKLLIDDQHEVLQRLNQIVRSAAEFRAAEADGKLVRLPTGDGMALVFFNNPEAPVQCAMEISKAAKGDPKVQLRMGIHSGAVSGVNDGNDRSNVAGAGINMAQRVMDCGDSGHILLSKRAAEDLTSYSRWHQYLHDLGDCEVKHGVVVSLFNLYTDELGNPKVPEGLKQREQNRAAEIGAPQSAISRAKQLIGIVALFVLFAGIVVWLTQSQAPQAAVIQKQAEQVTAIVGRYEKMQEALVRLAAVEAQAKQPGEKLAPEEQRARAYTVLEKDLGLPTGSLAKELPAFALELYNRADTTALMRARAAYALNKFDEAEKLSLEAASQDRQAYETAQRVQEERRKGAIESYTLAGESAQKLIQFDKAMEHFREAEKLTDRERNAGDWAAVQYSIGDLLLNQGQYSNAENTLRSVVEVRTHAFGPEHPETLKSRDLLAMALARGGKSAESEEQYREVIKVQEKVIGPEHPNTLLSRKRLAIALFYQGKYAESEGEVRAVLKLQEKVIGPEHPSTLGTRNNLAVMLAQEGKYAEAEAQYREVITLQEKVLGPEHPDTLQARGNLAIALESQSKYAEAEAQYRETIKLYGKVLGPEHPETLRNRGNLAGVLNKQGRYTEAEAQEREIIKLQEKVLGREHPNTLAVRNDLADALDQQGRYAEAEEQYREVIKLREKVLGSKHPDTLNSRSGLAKTLMDQGKDAAAKMREVIKLQGKRVG